MLKRLAITIIILLAVLSLSIPAFADTSSPPPDAITAAKAALDRFKSQGKGKSDNLGFAPNDTESMIIDRGYHAVMWNPAKKPLNGNPDAVLEPFGQDRWIFTVKNNGGSVMLIHMVNTDKGWREAVFEPLRPEVASALEDAINLIQSNGTKAEGEPLYFMFRSYRFWYLRGAGKAFVYATLPENHPGLQQLGLTRKQVYPAEAVMKKLAELPVSKEPGAGGGASASDIMLPVATVGLVCLCIGGALGFMLRKRLGKM